jgi:hypothetical protein
MNSIRKALGSLFAVLGTYYVARSTFTLVRLPTVTESWIQRSGDPDFKYDQGLFLMLSAIGLVSIAAFGLTTIARGVAATRGHRVSWLGLAIAGIPLHFFWMAYRTIGMELHERAAEALVMRNNAIWLGAVCVSYFLMWILMREPKADRPSSACFDPAAFPHPQ